MTQVEWDRGNTHVVYRDSNFEFGTKSNTVFFTYLIGVKKPQKLWEKLFVYW